MKKEEELVCKFMHNFAKANWDKINLEKTELIKEDKEKFLQEVLTDVQTAMWMLGEVCMWGMDKEYLKELYVDHDGDFHVIKIDDTYIKIKWINNLYVLTVVEPQYKIITYFK